MGASSCSRMGHHERSFIRANGLLLRYVICGWRKGPALLTNTTINIWNIWVQQNQIIFLVARGTSHQRCPMVPGVHWLFSEFFNRPTLGGDPLENRKISQIWKCQDSKILLLLYFCSTANNFLIKTKKVFFCGFYEKLTCSEINSPEAVSGVGFASPDMQTQLLSEPSFVLQPGLQIFAHLLGKLCNSYINIWM